MNRIFSELWKCNKKFPFWVIFFNFQALIFSKKLKSKKRIHFFKAHAHMFWLVQCEYGKY